MGNLNPKFYKSHVFNGSQRSNVGVQRTTVEYFLDYNCPFSAKIFKKLNNELLPILKSKGIDNKFDITFVNVVQPWHHLNSGASHEVALAVAQAYPTQFWKFSSVLFEHIEEFYDTELYETTRKQLYAKLIKLAVENLEDVDANKLWSLVEIKPSSDGKPHNSGNEVTNDLKYFTRYERTLGVHVTPTVAVNGIIKPNIESSTDSSKVATILENEL